MTLRVAAVAILLSAASITLADEESKQEREEEKDFSVLSLTYLKTNTHFAPELDLKGAGLKYENYTFDSDHSFFSSEFGISEVKTFDYDLRVTELSTSFSYGHTFSGFTPFATFHWAREKTTLTKDEDDVKEVVRGWDYGFGFALTPKEKLIIFSAKSLRKRSDGIDVSASLLFKATNDNSMKLGYERTFNTAKDSDAVTIGWSSNF